MHKNLIFDYSKPEKSACQLPKDGFSEISLDELKDIGVLNETPLNLPEVSEIDIVRHYTHLSTLNFGVDTGFYPLGSCTMKYNPKINENIAALAGYLNCHPLQDPSEVQGFMQIYYEVEQYLCELFGFHSFSLQPAAGAHGEFTGLLIMKAYHQDQGNSHKDTILVPDSAHGTNPASASCVAWKIKPVKSINGVLDIEDLKQKLNENVAGLMITNPNTLGIYETNIEQIAELIHSIDGLVYWDGANANAVMGYLKPGKTGCDICHINLHKTFATPHGGGGPGAGPVGVIKQLVKYLPYPIIDKNNDSYFFKEKNETSIGKIHSFYGNAGVIIKAYVYMKMLGAKGLKEATENTVLLANYMKKQLEPYYEIVTPDPCKHEFIISLKKERKEYGIRATDVAKRLMDYQFHPPTVYFPIIVSEALMIEVPETETVETVDAFIDAMIKIKTEMKENKSLLLNAPHQTTVQRLDEVKAVKEPILKYHN